MKNIVLPIVMGKTIFFIKILILISMLAAMLLPMERAYLEESYSLAASSLINKNTRIFFLSLAVSRQRVQ